MIDVVGGNRVLSFNLTDPVAGPVDATVALTVAKPDGTIITPAVIRLALGKWSAAVPLDLPGVWRWSWHATGAYFASMEGTFAVRQTVLAAGAPVPDPLIIDPAHVFRRALVPTPDPSSLQWQDAVDLIGQAQGVIASHLGRALSVQQVTETVYAASNGRVLLSRLPVVSVDTVVAAPSRYDTLQVSAFGDGFSGGFGSSFDAGEGGGSGLSAYIWGLDGLSTVAPADLLMETWATGTGFTVSYHGGLDGPSLPAVCGILTTGAARVLKRWIEDTVGLYAVRFGDGEGFTFDRITGTQVDPATSGFFTDEELGRLSIHRQRVIA